MSSYGTFLVNEFELFGTRNEPSPDVLIIFQEEDKAVTPFPVPTDGDPDDFPRHRVTYRAPVAIVRDRLELLGFTLARSRRDFEAARSAELDRMAQDASELYLDSEEIREWRAEQQQVLDQLTFDLWRELLARVIRESRQGLPMGSPEWERATPVERRIMGSWSDEFFGFPGYDARPFLRAVCDIVAPDAMLTYDLTDLVEAGYVDEGENLTSWSARMDSEDEFFGRGIIVLTEGKSDQRLLERSLSLLAPHLASYFNFVDFDLHKVEGGAGRLVHALKVFTGAGVINRMIAVFDNDTAAASALESLQDVPLRPSVRVLRYPDLELGRNYPTLGPHGLIPADVNGLAGGLELYFGRDVLLNPDGILTPVQWKGYDDRLARYQGELISKGVLQRRFEEKLRACEEEPSRMGEYDWSGMRIIVDALVQVFNQPLV